METASFNIPVSFSRHDYVEIIPVGDLHVGSIGFNRKKLLETVQYIKDNPKAYMVGMGDYCECINILDKRFDPYSIHGDYDIRDTSRLVQKQLDDVIEIFEPVKHKMIGFIIGNHEETIRLRYFYSIGYELQKAWGVKCLGYNGFIQVKMVQPKREAPSQTLVYTLYVHHGFGGSRKDGAKINRIQDMMSNYEADVIILAHEHRRVVAPPLTRMGVDKAGNIKNRGIYGFMSGTFREGHVMNATQYEEIKGYPPSDIGTVKIVMGTRERRISGGII